MIEIDPTERVIKTVRKHWIVLVGHIALLIALIITPIIAWAVIPHSAAQSFFTLTGPKVFLDLFLFSSWFLSLWVMTFLSLTDYYLDVLVITDKRVFNIEQHGLFSRESTAFRIERIQNVSVDVTGIIATFLGFGTLTIETAGEGRDFIAPMIGHPYEVKKLINEEIDKAIESTRGRIDLDGNPVAHAKPEPDGT